MLLLTFICGCIQSIVVVIAGTSSRWCWITLCGTASSLHSHQLSEEGGGCVIAPFISWLLRLWLRLCWLLLLVRWHVLILLLLLLLWRIVALLAGWPTTRAKIHCVLLLTLLLSHRLMMLPLDVVLAYLCAADECSALNQLMWEVTRFMILLQVLNFLQLFW